MAIFRVSLFMVLLCSWAWSAPQNVNAMGVAIDGYDPVAYFTESKAKRGQAAYSMEHEGVRWWFSSEANLALFSADPQRYMPAYAGHCANGLSDGHLVRANPEIFRIIDDRLYLFFSWWGKAQWKYNQQEQIELATKNWLRFSESENF